MDVLFLALEPPFPPDDGGRIRTLNILKQVSRRHAVTLVTFCDPEGCKEALGELGSYCQEIVSVPHPSQPSRTWFRKVCDFPRRYPVALAEYASEEMRARVQELVRNGAFDVAHVDQIYLAQYVSDLAPLPAVLTHHNVEAEAQRRELEARRDRLSPRWWINWLEHRRWRRFEIEASRRFDALAVVSERDAAYFNSQASKVPVRVVPNGVDTALFQPIDQPVEHPTLLYTGRMDYLPNVDAMLWFCREVLPLIRQRQPQVVLTIVGRNPAPEVQALASLPGVTVTGSVPDVRPYFTHSAVYVVPLRLGGGTRLKVLEAMAMGMPVVSTRLGCEGLDLLPGRDVLVADDVDCFADEVVQLLKDAEARLHLSKQARQTVERCYDWSMIAYEQERAYEIAISRGCS